MLQLRKSDDSYRSSWITPDEIPDPDLANLSIKGYTILVRPVEPAKQIGSVVLPESFKEDIKYLVNIGRVLSMGNLCYRDPSSKPGDPGYPYGKYLAPWCEPGSYVVYPKLTGTKVQINGVVCVMVNDDQVMATVRDPAALNPFFNVMKESGV